MMRLMEVGSEGVRRSSMIPLCIEYNMDSSLAS